MPGHSPVKRVLRSKGFIWQSSSHDSAYFWSHAGQHFVIHDEGKWCETEQSCVLYVQLYLTIACCIQLVLLLRLFS